MQTIINSSNPGELYEPPINYDSANIRYWEDISKDLFKDKNFSILNKAKSFIDNNCIVITGPTNWQCKPLEGYNTRTYEIRLSTDGFECSCQGFKKKKLDFNLGKGDIKPLCSHIVAVRQFNFLEDKR